MTVEQIWIGIGFFGQGLFFTRFLIQWVQTERKRQSTIPIAFWYFSIFGSLILLSYAIYKEDIVFIVGQSMGIIIYLRNLYFIYFAKNNMNET